MSPNYGAQPLLSGGFAVTAFTQQPATVSSSADFLPAQWHVGLTPSGVSAPVALGAAVTLHAQILDQLNHPVHAHNVAIFMSQVIYSQQGLAYGSASINGQAPGTTPVLGVTGPNGTTSFVIRDAKAQIDPIYFQASLFQAHGSYAYGNSEIVAIRFAPRASGVNR